MSSKDLESGVKNDQQAQSHAEGVRSVVAFTSDEVVISCDLRLVKGAWLPNICECEEAR